MPVIGPELEAGLGVLEPAGTGRRQDEQPECPDRQLAAAVMAGRGRGAFTQGVGLLPEVLPARDEGAQAGVTACEGEPPQQAQSDQHHDGVSHPLVPLLSRFVEPEIADTDGRHPPVGEADQTIPVEGISLSAWHSCGTPSSGR